MLVKNFNNLLAYRPFNLSDGTDAQQAQMLTGARVAVNSDYWTGGLSTWKGDAAQSDGVALILSTSPQVEDINTYAFNNIFSAYEITSNIKSNVSHDIGCAYTRVIVPAENAVIQSIGLVCSNDDNKMLIGFENLAEPVQLTAGEPHTFSFAIKVSN
nr:MAG TPA: hypothetical protein [Caudoviricetes sp.]